MVIFPRLKQFSNSDFSILFIEFEIVTSVRLIQKENAPCPTFSTELGMLTQIRLEQL